VAPAADWGETRAQRRDRPGGGVTRFSQLTRRLNRAVCRRRSRYNLVARGKCFQAKLPVNPVTCFLCQPDRALVYHETKVGRALCGLGPLMPGYSVVASLGHVPSAADLLRERGNDFVLLAAQVRDSLEREFGPTIVTEHGRVPVCDDNTREQHCYHAHFLMFPSAPSILEAAVNAYRKFGQFGSMDSALLSVPEDDEYLLLSEEPGSYSVLLEPRRTCRQFARTLIAQQMGVPHLASWRLRPQHDEASLNAARLRRVFANA